MAASVCLVYRRACSLSSPYARLNLTLESKGLPHMLGKTSSRVAQWLHVNSNRMTSTPQTLCTIWWMMKSQDLETRVGIICSFLLASWKLEASQAPTCAPCNFARPFLQLQSSEISSPNIRNIIDEEKYSTQGLVSDQTLKKQEQRNSPLHHPQWGLEASKMIFAYVDIC